MLFQCNFIESCSETRLNRQYEQDVSTESYLESCGRAALALLHPVLCLNMADYLCYTGLHHQPSHADLGEDVVNLVDMKD